MRVLAFDTATAATVVAVDDVEARDDPSAGGRPGHASKLLSLIGEAMHTAGVSWPEIDRIAVGVGPGTFTGLRIGLASAQALSRSVGIELVGISTLESLALAGREASRGSAILAVIDARRGEAFTGAWFGDGEVGLEPSVLTPEALEQAAARVSDVARSRSTDPADTVIAVGDGALKFRTVLERSGVTVAPENSSLHRVSAVHHCRLALTAIPGNVEPVYLRVPDAERTHS